MNTTNVSAPALLMSVLCASTAGQAETIRHFTGLNYWDEERAHAVHRGHVGFNHRRCPVHVVEDHA